jgi:hypothetical protein
MLVHLKPAASESGPRTASVDADQNAFRDTQGLVRSFSRSLGASPPQNSIFAVEYPSYSFSLIAQSAATSETE